MSRTSAKFLQVFVVLTGIGALAFLLWEPQAEGRNAHATLYQTYFRDPFLAYAYIASIPFFVGVAQAYKALGYATQQEAFSPLTSRALRKIRHCAIAIIGFAALGEVFILFGESDDRAGGVFMGIIVTLGSIAVATMAAILERAVRRRLA
jgi:Protein of unknown function (DUF2975)